MSDENQSSDGCVAEEWRPVVGWEGYYSVSSLGRVRSETRRGHNTKPGRARRLTGKVKRPSQSAWGYLQARMTRGGVPTQKMVHRLVVEAFIGPVEKGFQVDHKNGIKTDNRVENLEIVTPKQNVRHCHATGLTLNHGETHCDAKLTFDDVRDIRRRAGTVSQADMAREYGVDASCISRIVSRKAWRNVPDCDEFGQPIPTAYVFPEAAPACPAS